MDSDSRAPSVWFFVFVCFCFVCLFVCLFLTLGEGRVGSGDLALGEPSPAETPCGRHRATGAVHLSHPGQGTFRGKAEVPGHLVACSDSLDSLDMRKPKVSAGAPRLLRGRRPKLVQHQGNLCCYDNTQREAVGVDARQGSLDR